MVVGCQVKVGHLFWSRKWASRRDERRDVSHPRPDSRTLNFDSLRGNYPESRPGLPLTPQKTLTPCTTPGLTPGRSSPWLGGRRPVAPWDRQGRTCHGSIPTISKVLSSTLNRSCRYLIEHEQWHEIPVGEMITVQERSSVIPLLFEVTSEKTFLGESRERPRNVSDTIRGWSEGPWGPRISTPVTGEVNTQRIVFW